jgi:hypothetical protein
VAGSVPALAEPTNRQDAKNAKKRKRKIQQKEIVSLNLAQRFFLLSSVLGVLGVLAVYLFFGVNRP